MWLRQTPLYGATEGYKNANIFLLTPPTSPRCSCTYKSVGADGKVCFLCSLTPSFHFLTSTYEIGQALVIQTLRKADLNSAINTMLILTYLNFCSNKKQQK